MKKLLYSFAVVLIFAAFAVPVSAQKMMIGPRVGLNLANLAIDSSTGETLSMKLGLLAGGQLDIWFSDMWALSVQMLYDQKGVHVVPSTSIPGYTSSADLNFNTLEIPILAKVALGTGDVKPYVFAGPSIGIRLGANEHLKSSGSFDGFSNNVDTTMDISDSTSSLDLSLVVGAGVSLNIGSSGMQVFLDAAYAFGLMNLNNGADKSIDAFKSRDIRIAAGLLFPLN